ncbi:MAG: hypothetical protein JST64_03935 [Actinobacteria bacterium]|nr:hypothetical protein [Actinomycetota bacterium]
MHDELDLDLRVGTDDWPDHGLCAVLDAGSLPSEDALTVLRRGMSTGLTVIVPPGAANGARLVDLADRVPSELRVELLVCEPDPSTTDRLAELGRRWSTLTGVDAEPARVSWLDAATAQAGGEIVAVPSSSPASELTAPFGHLVGALGLLWVNGADGLVIDATPVVPGVGPSAPSASAFGGGLVDDLRVEQLAVGLGLRRGAGARLVVLRRWVARFLLDEISRAIDPVAELASRVRLLELRLVVLRCAVG